MIDFIMDYVRKNRLPVMVVGALIIAAIMTSLSLSLYVSSGASKLDLSRPGFESTRQEVTVDERENETFDPTGPLDDYAINDFRRLYDKQRQEIDDLGDFNGDLLSDETLNLFDETN